MSAIEINKIVVRENIRKTTDKTADKELLDSVKQYGIIEPVIVREENKQFILVAGHRRLAAAKAAKLKQVPIRTIVADEAMAADIQLIENIQRKDLNVMEEAVAYKKFVNQWPNGSPAPVWSHIAKKALPSNALRSAVSAIAKRVGKPKAYIAKVVRLNELPAKVRSWIAAGKLTEEHGFLLLNLPTEGIERAIRDFLERAVSALYPGDSVSVNDFKTYLDRTFLRNVAQAAFPTDVDYAGEVACSACPFNTGNANLFGKKEDGRCTQASCWTKKGNQVYKDIRDSYAKKKEFKNHRFAGFGRIVSNWSGKIQLPSLISCAKVYPFDGLKGELKKLWAKDNDAFRWGLVKPSQDSPKPKVTPVWVLVKPEALPKKAQPKIEEAGDEYDYEKATFVRERGDAAVSTAILDKAVGMKADLDNLRTFASLEWENAPIVDIALTIGMIDKKDKKKDLSKTLSYADIAKLLLVAVAIHRRDGSFLGVDTQKIELAARKQAIKEYDESKKKSKRKEEVKA